MMQAVLDGNKQRKVVVEAESVEAVAEMLLRRYRPELYRREFVKVTDDGRQVATLIKTRNDMCPVCGAVHGREIRLITTDRIGSAYQVRICHECEGGKATEAACRESQEFRQFLEESKDYEANLR